MRAHREQFCADIEATKIAFDCQVIGVIAKGRTLTRNLFALEGVDTDGVPGHTRPGQAAGILVVAGAAAELGVDLKPLEYTIYIGAIDIETGGSTHLDAHVSDSVAAFIARRRSHGSKVSGVIVAVAMIEVDRRPGLTRNIDFGNFNVVVLRQRQVDINRSDLFLDRFEIDVENAILTAIERLRQLRHSGKNDIPRSLGQLVGKLAVDGDFVIRAGIEDVVGTENLKIAVEQVVDPEGEFVSSKVDVRIEGGPIDVWVVGIKYSTPVNRLVIIGQNRHRAAFAAAQTTGHITLALVTALAQAHKERFDI